MQRILQPGDIEALDRTQLPRIRLPQPASLFADRAARLAQKLEADWMVVHVASAQRRGAGAARYAAAMKTLALAVVAALISSAALTVPARAQIEVDVNRGDIKRVTVENRRDKQRLSGDLMAIESRFEFLVKNALVCRVHIDEDQPMSVLRQDVNTVQLGQCIAKRRSVVSGCAGKRWRFRTSYRVRCRAAESALAEGEISCAGRFSDAK